MAPVLMNSASFRSSAGSCDVTPSFEVVILLCGCVRVCVCVFVFVFLFLFLCLCLCGFRFFFCDSLRTIFWLAETRGHRGSVSRRTPTPRPTTDKIKGRFQTDHHRKDIAVEPDHLCQRSVLDCQHFRHAVAVLPPHAQKRCIHVQ
jgi:hypothetical protein